MKTVKKGSVKKGDVVELGNGLLVKVVKVDSKWSGTTDRFVITFYQGIERGWAKDYATNGEVVRVFRTTN